MQTSEVVIRRKSWKKCAAHVHISHLIRSLEVPNGQVAKEPDRVHHGTDCGVLLETHNLNWMSNRNSSASGIVHSATVRSSHEAKSGTPQQHSRYHDMSQTPAPGVYGPQKQVSLWKLLIMMCPLARSSSSPDDDYSYTAEFQLLVLVCWR